MDYPSKRLKRFKRLQRLETVTFKMFHSGEAGLVSDLKSAIKNFSANFPGGL